MNKNTHKKIILITEDDRVLLRILKKSFASANYKIVTATDGEAAIKKTIKEKPNLIVLDLLLPKVNGLQVLSTIKMMDELKNIPVLVLSNLGNESTIAEAKSLGADYYYVKADINLADILKKVKNILENEVVKRDL